jgi:ribosome biogenesis GTPase / thiamine phosphate phosphatase
VKMKSSGERTYEPRLERKKYRRHSRKQQHQQLEEWRKEIEDFGHS